MLCEKFVYTSTLCARRKHIWQLLVMPVVLRFAGPAKVQAAVGSYILLRDSGRARIQVQHLLS